MPLTKEQINKIKLDSLVDRRLKEIQNIANKEAEIRNLESMRLKAVSADVDRLISMKRMEIETAKEFIKTLDKMIDDYYLGKEKKEEK